jgi:peptidoglycan hydrolase CwlO-like protein
LVSNINADHQKEIEDLKVQIQYSQKARDKLEEDNHCLAEENQKLKLDAELLTSNLMEKDDKLSKLED